MLNVNLIKGIIPQIPFIKNVVYHDKDSLSLCGNIEVLFEGLVKPLDFEFKILPQYPLKSYNTESIIFINKNLLKYNHVMEDGAICIHTSYNPDIKQKIFIDFYSLKNWIEKYYIKWNQDEKYEHIIVNANLLNDKYYAYIFTNLDHTFKEGDFGKVKISFLNNGCYKEKIIKNYLIQGFYIDKEELIKCNWSSYYNKDKELSYGFYVFIDKHPAQYNKFAFKSFNELENIIPSDFLNFIFNYEKDKIKSNKGLIVPILIGYKTIKDEIHWQTLLFEIGEFPIKEDYENKNNILVPVKKLIDQRINWAITYNSSYNYFFGRGALNKKITNAKILIIGIGAIGSIVAKSLVKGGCKFIDIADHDIKEPENVCRSEYLFNSGLTDKVWELEQILSAYSPFVEIKRFKKEYFEDIIKSLSTKIDLKEHFSSILNDYDIIFDCSTDNDLMYVLESLILDCCLINMSITNHAKELVCAFYPNIYHFVNTQFSNLLDNDLDDIYEPTGCWNPTFKASYTDISLLVQTSIKKINHCYENKKIINNFVVTIQDNNFSIRIDEY